MKPVIGIWLEFGFHDVKKYIHSGFYKQIAHSFNIVWFSIDKESKEFDDYFRSTGFPVKYIDVEALAKKTLKIEGYNIAIRKAWMKKNSIGVFNNYTQQRERKFRDEIAGLGIIKSLLEKITLLVTERYYFSKYVDSLFKQYNIVTVLSTNSYSTFSKAFMITAQANHLKTFYLVNSWKDLYINDFVPFTKLTGMFVWSERMKKEYLLHMPYLREDSLYVTGNPTFDTFVFSPAKQPRNYYSEKYGIDENADWLYYTMAPPSPSRNDEIEIAIAIAKTLLKHYSKHEKVILLRRNPNHSKEDFLEMNLPENLILTTHYSTYDIEKDMIVQSQEGEDEWLDLVTYSTLNISIPSTVSLEFLLKNKKIININFGSNGKYDQRLKQFVEAEFYKPLFERSDVVLCNSPEEIIEVINSYSKHEDEKQEDAIISVPENGASVEIVRILADIEGEK